jgi:YVTN family beta-propeller protein
MYNYGEIQRKLIFLIVLNFIVLALVIGSSNFTYALENSELHQKTLDVITKHTSSENPHIAVGKTPVAMAVDPVKNKIYVVNSGDDTVSVIDGRTYTKIVKDIKVGNGPRAIAENEPTNKMYVANSADGTVSVIDAEVNKVVAKVMFNIKTL